LLAALHLNKRQINFNLINGFWSHFWPCFVLTAKLISISCLQIQIAIDITAHQFGHINAIFAINLVLRIMILVLLISVKRSDQLMLPFRAYYPCHVLGLTLFGFVCGRCCLCCANNLPECCNSSQVNEHARNNNRNPHTSSVEPASLLSDGLTISFTTSE